MKLLFDQNLSFRLTMQLAAEFPGSTHVRNVGMAAAPDQDVWAYATNVHLRTRTRVGYDQCDPNDLVFHQD